MVYKINITELKNIIEKELLKFNKLNKEKKQKLIQYHNKNIVNLKNLIHSFYFNIKFMKDIENFLKKNKIKLIIVDNNDKILNTIVKKYKYKLQKELGSGARGYVYHIIKKGKDYALKLEEYRRNEDTKFTFEDFIMKKIREYEIGKKLAKENIAPKVYNNIFMFNKNDNTLYCITIMELIRGETLLRYTGNNTSKIEKMVDKLIKKMHNLDIFHLDLHRDNIMIVGKGKNIKLKLIDFGHSLSINNIKKNYKKRNTDMAFYDYDYNQDIGQFEMFVRFLVKKNVIKLL